MDFNTHFALLFYPGGVSGRKGFRISRIYRQDNQIVVHARPGSSEGFQLDLAVRPYQLIEVEKSENWAGKFTFQLYFDENAPPVISTTHHFAQAQEGRPFPPGDLPATPATNDICHSRYMTFVTGRGGGAFTYTGR